MSFGRWMVAVVSLMLVVTVAPAYAAASAPTELTLSAPGGYADDTTSVAVVLTHSGGTPLPGVQVVVERRVSGAWQAAGTVTTGDDGSAALSQELSRVGEDNVWRATYAGDATYAAAVSADVLAPLRRRESVVTLSGPGRVVDERSVALTVRWRTRSGAPVAGTVHLQQRVAGGGWRRVATLRTRADGRTQARVGPRVDTRYRVRAQGVEWVYGDRSPVLVIDNVPPRPPVALPKGAPRPRITLPPQPRAVGEGANVTVGRIPDAVWRQMVGVSWHRGCPVGRDGLRLVRVNYWDYEGYRRRGEVVTAADAAGKIGGALAQMYRRGFPIRAMYRIDRFGYSRRLQGGNDYKSMAAGNTSAFNCRHVVNRPGVRSPHSYGRSLDVNTWENPYRSATGLVPNTWWQSRSHPLVAWRSGGHPVVRLMRSHGLRWTYGTGDSQHFDAAHHGRVLLPRVCLAVVCH
ncbi:M15 family metallopeptidase [Nocardioides sp. cx-173]|uniref:M15 family metallopeptidase n=1 Tax=Nocardioides sp. cx-173 TaxID=2898796 RepID=UPI001E3B7D83|nr:M15 family metallopeptidase [Nocardioides sp. cx-173]MCD4527011.1 M15 family metallopeptidase [Nocardioides sp. cx-173]UGB41054.1 M15 family metallopeptidase [Nocardioides sp. cx-173]